MPPKQVVSFGLEPEVLKEINRVIEEAKRDGTEMDFSKWMRDAVRKKLRQGRTAEPLPKYRTKRKKK